MGSIRFGRDNSVYGGIIIKQTGMITNVSTAGYKTSIPFAKVCTIERIFIRNVTPGPVNGMVDYPTHLEIADMDPDDPNFKTFNVIYRDEGVFSHEWLDDVLTRINYASESGLDEIWIRVTPAQGSSNKYEFRLDGKLAVAAPALTPVDITVP